jgi:hypothetical protein
MAVEDIKIEVIERRMVDRSCSYTVLFNGWVYVITKDIRIARRFLIKGT